MSVIKIQTNPQTLNIQFEVPVLCKGNSDSQFGAACLRKSELF